MPRAARVARRSAGAAGLAALLVLGGASAAPAAFAPGAQPASAIGSELADDGSFAPLVSGDGRYVVFGTRSPLLLGRPANPEHRYSAGIVRKDLVTGDIALVAPPVRVRRDDATVVVAAGTGGSASGISRDGRYVLFGTTASLAPGDQSSITPDVYVRDMDAAVTDTVGGYELVSAQDGGVRAAEYVDTAVGSVPGLAGYALSADGRRAVFVSAGASNLPDRTAPSTPPRQVWIRDLDRHATVLVTRDRTDPSAVGTPVAPETGAGVPEAALSADGSAVVWAGTGVRQQALFLTGEPPTAGLPQLLWRDLGQPTAPARRVAGAADPDDPACDPASGFVDDGRRVGPCYGPFASGEGSDANGGTILGNLALAGISGNGRQVLFTSSAPRRPLDVAAHRNDTVYRAEMGVGVPRKHGVGVAWANPSITGRFATDAPRFAVDGRHATFASRDNRFDGLQPVGSFPTGDLLTFNHYLVDLERRTVERITAAHDGGDYVTAERATSGTAAALSEALDVAAFAAGDGNLFVGDANGVADVLVARPPRRADGGHEQRDLPLPPAAPTMPVDVVRPLPSRFPIDVGRVSVARRTGTATVRLRLPAAGTLVATADSSVRVARRTRTVRVGRTTRKVSRPGRVTVRVPLSAAARRALARTPHRLRVRLRLRFTPRGVAASTVTRRYTVTAPRTPTTKTRKAGR